MIKHYGVEFQIQDIPPTSDIIKKSISHYSWTNLTMPFPYLYLTGFHQNDERY